MTTIITTRKMGNLQTESLWNKHNITYNGQSFYFKTWARFGINYVQDLWTNATMLIQEQIVQITGNHLSWATN